MVAYFFLTCKVNYVIKQENFINRQDNYVQIKVNYVDMQVTILIRELDFLYGQKHPYRSF